MSSFADQLLDLLYNPVKQAEHTLKLADYEKNRTDPWVWYCRTCGVKGEAETETRRDAEGYDHLDNCSRPRRPTTGTDAVGRLRHVWSY